MSHFVKSVRIKTTIDAELASGGLIDLMKSPFKALLEKEEITEHVLITREAFEMVISPIYGRLPTDAKALNRLAALCQSYVLGFRDAESIISKLGAKTVSGERFVPLLAISYQDEAGKEVVVIDFAD